MRKILATVGMVAILLLVVAVSSPAVAGASAIRDLPDGCVDPNAVFTVQIEASGYGSFGEVAETLCDGWTYTGTSLQESQVNTDTAGVVKFYPWDDQTFTYTVQAPSTEGAQCVIDGTLKNATMHTSAVGGEDDVRVCTENGGGDEASATRTFLTADDCSCGGDLCVAPSTVFTVQIEASGYGSFGEVAETLCDGWTYTGTSLQESQVNTDTAGVVKFYPWDDQTFTYTVQAPSTEGECCTIDGTLMNATMHTFTVGGEDEICICTSNIDPTVDLIYPTGGELSGEITLNASATDSDGSVVSVVFYRSGDAGTTWDEIGAGASASDYYTRTWNTKEVDNGDYKIKAVATDNGGATGEDTSDVTIDNGFCITLDAGWNMVSIPKTIDSSSSNKAPDVFNLVGGETCDSYNGCAQVWSSNWDVSVVPCRGYFVYKLAPATICMDLEIGNSAPPSQQLCAGWNLVGHIDTSERSVEEFASMTTLGDKIAQVWHRTSDGTWTGYPYWGLDTMIPGDGYWLLMNEDGVMYGTP